MTTIQQQQQQLPPTMAKSMMIRQQPPMSSNDNSKSQFPRNVSSKTIRDDTTTTTTMDKENSVNHTSMNPRHSRSFHPKNKKNNVHERIAFGGTTTVVVPSPPPPQQQKGTPSFTDTSVFHPYQTPKHPKTVSHRTSTSTTSSSTHQDTIIHHSTNTNNTGTTTPYSILSMEMSRFRSSHPSTHRNMTSQLENENMDRNNENVAASAAAVAEEEEEDDDISLLCSPVIPHPTDPFKRRRIQPTQLTSLPGRVPVHSTTMALSEANDQITIFQTSKASSPPPPRNNNNAAWMTTASSDKITANHNVPVTIQANAVAPNFNGLSRPPLTIRTNDDTLRHKQGILKQSQVDLKKQPPTQLREGTQRPPQTITTTLLSSDPPVSTSTKSTRFAMFAESPKTVATTTTSTFLDRNSTSTKVHPTFSMLHPPPEGTPFVSTTLYSTYTAGTSSATKNPKSICLDLSDIFFDAASKPSVRKPRPPELPPASNRVIFTDTAPSASIIQKQRMENEIQNVHESDDQEWAEKQVEMFTKWINFLFYPTESQPGATSMVPTDENRSTSTALRTLVLHQRMAQGRTAAHSLFHSTEMVRIRDIVCHEIGKNKIALRPDRDDLCANLDHRNMILSVLLSYSTPWLRLGLETMFHTVISPDMPALFSPNPTHRALKGKGPSKTVPMSRLKWTLRNFILHNVLSDDKVLAKYTGGKCKVPSGPFEDRYRAELRTVVTYRLLVLILFLDRAKTSNILDQAPNLFTSSSTIKSTKDVLLFICRNFLKAEGDFTKHLSRLGIKVQYQQEAVDEIDFSVTNLRVDLNDGVRLTRMTELLTGVTLLPKLRLPAVSRLQKLYNVKLAIDHLIQAGVPIPDSVAPYHVVDGHREMVLKLLWSVVAHCCLQALLSVEQVEEEISRIQRYHGMSQPPLHDDRHEDDNDLQRVLLRWCNLVCSRFGRNVYDFTHSFSDGKAFCLLIHYYHPTLIRLKEIQMTSRDALSKYNNPDKLMSNERSNGFLANSRMSDLGGIPEVIPICDTSHPPEEKAVVFCLTFLCSRLITSSVEIRACLIIQCAYRNYRERQTYVFKLVAAKMILLAWRSNKDRYFDARKRRYSKSVQVIEQFTLANKSKLYDLCLRRLDHQKANSAAVVVQKICRGLHAKKLVKSIAWRRTAAIILQSMWRQELARRQVFTLLIRNDAAHVIQKAWHASQYQDTQKNNAATHIQRLFRGYCRRVEYIVDVLDIIAVQSCVRRFIALQNYKLIKASFTRERRVAATCIQCCWRWKKARDASLEMKHSVYRKLSAIVIQSLVRSWIARTKMHQVKYEAVVYQCTINIQSMWRTFKCRMVLNLLKANRRSTLAAITIQAMTRRYLAKSYSMELKYDALVYKSAELIQAMWRGKCSRSLIGVMHFASTIIQSTWRRSVSICDFHIKRFCAVVIQSHWRRRAATKSFQQIVLTIRKLQNSCRRFLAKTKYQRRKIIVCKIQSTWRMWSALKELQRLKHFRTMYMNATILVQRIWRGYSIKNTFKLVKRDAVVIQSFYRCYHTCRHFNKAKQATVTAQSVIRQFLAQKQLLRLVEYRIEIERKRFNATVRIQAMFRGAIDRSILRHRHCSAIEIQRCIRGTLGKVDIYRLVCCIIRVQSVVRRWLACRTVCLRQDAIVRIQALARKFFAVGERRNLTLLQQKAVSEHSATLAIQSLHRGRLGRHMALRESSARKIQKTWRCYTVHVEYMLSILAAIDIQATVRRFQAIYHFKLRHAAIVCLQSFTRFALTKIKQQREIQCATKLQSFARMVNFRSILVRQKVEYENAILIQSYYRRYLSRSVNLRLHVATTTLQRYARGFLLRLQLETEGFAAVEIQRIWLGFTAREFFAWNVLAAIKLQSYFRREICKSLTKQIKNGNIADRFLAAKSATKIQLCYRKYRQHVGDISAATMIQRTAKRFLSLRMFSKVRRGILKTQCLVRGFIVRQNRSTQLRDQARRIETANEKALSNPNMKLGYRTRDSLNILVNSKSLAEIIDATCVLEVATRLSEVCCTTIADAAAPDILFSVIQTCNRSLPHLKLLQYILLTLSNVARFDKLVPTMASLLGVEVFLDLVQMFRDKDYIFCLVVSLLDRIIRSNIPKMVLFISKENVKRLQGVRDLCVRKHTVSGSDKQAQRRMSFESSLQSITNTYSRRTKKEESAEATIHKGIRRLQQLIRLIEKYTFEDSREG